MDLYGYGLIFVRGAVSVDIHPAWNESDVFSGNDIAIITLDR